MSTHKNHESHKSHKKEYTIIFAILAFLTAIELYIPELKASTLIKGSALVAVATIKAFLVAYYFMHLNEEKGWLRFIAAIPIAAVLFAAVTILESIFR